MNESKNTGKTYFLRIYKSINDKNTTINYLLKHIIL